MIAVPASIVYGAGKPIDYTTLTGLNLNPIVKKVKEANV